MICPLQPPSPPMNSIMSASTWHGPLSLPTTPSHITKTPPSLHPKRSALTSNTSNNRSSNNISPYPTSPTVGHFISSTRPTLAEGPPALSFNQLSVSEGESRPPVDQRHAYAPPTDAKSTSGPLKTLEVAIDFVLALEHPCMGHLASSEDPTGEDPANHMMMVSCLLDICDQDCIISYHPHLQVN